MTSPDKDRLQVVPDENGEPLPGLEEFVERYGPEAGRVACAGANMLYEAISSGVPRIELNASAKAELDRQGVDPANTVVTSPASATVYNSEAQASMASIEPGWMEALRILVAIRRAPR